MKTKFTCAIILFLIVQISIAQKISLDGGLNVSTINFYSHDGNSNGTSIWAYHVGPLVEFYLNKGLNLNTGIRYSLNGFKTELENTLKLNYIEVPLNLVLKFIKNEKPFVFIEFGPYLGYAVNGKIKSNDVTVDVNFKELGFKRINSGLELSIGKVFGNLAVRICDQSGLTDINADPNDHTKIKTHVYRLSLAYIL